MNDTDAVVAAFNSGVYSNNDGRTTCQLLPAAGISCDDA